MMTPLGFEQAYQGDWAELEASIDSVLRRNAGTLRPRASVSGVRVAALYRGACENLALARARCYPAHMVDRLERLTADAHQVIYQRRIFGLARLWEIASVDFPSAVRRQAAYMTVAAAAFLLPAVVVGLLVASQPELILSLVSAETAASFDEMYSPSAGSIGRTRTATTDWMMFGFYIRNNLAVAFQCFAGGLFAGLGTLFYLAYNGAFGGALAGYLTERGLSSTFYPFIATHSAFELTAIVLSGAAGLRIGHALLVPGRLTRLQSLVMTTRDCAVLLYGMIAMLLVAAAIEAFWSSASWLPATAKYGSALVCWTAVLGYFAFQGRRAG